MSDDDWIPDELSLRPFTVSEARQVGMPSWRLRGGHLRRPTRGVRTVAPVDGVRQLARAFAAGLPDDVAFSHLTAARLWGMALPETVDSAGLDVMRTSDRNRIRRAGCHGHRGLESREVLVAQGLRVTAMADTWVDLGEVCDRGLGLDDLIVVGDQVATRLIPAPEPGDVGVRRDEGIRALRAVLDRRVRPRGAVLLREALDLVRAPVRSPMETRARLMFVRARFPEPVVNDPVHGADGHWLLEGDLVWREQRVIGEYQGKDHASIGRRSSDAARASIAEDEDWTVLEIFAADVYRRPRRIACLRRFARALGLDEATLQLD